MVFDEKMVGKLPSSTVSTLFSSHLELVWVFLGFTSAIERRRVPKTKRNSSETTHRNFIHLIFSGADLTALVHEAGILALKQRLEDQSVQAIGMCHLVQAAQRICPSVSKTDRERYNKLRDKYRRQ